MNQVTPRGDESKKAARREIHWTTVETSLGEALVAATEKGVCRVAFGERESDLEAHFAGQILVPDGPFVKAIADRVTQAIERPGAGGNIPLDIDGTPFQQRVWQALREIPVGETRSYGQVAAALGNPKASRAVGGANRANAVAVLVPCHRVIAADGSLGGYAYGGQIKTELLHRERAEAG